MSNSIKTVLLLGTMSGLVLAVGAVAAPGQLPMFAVLAVAMNFGAWLFSDRIVLRMHHAREVSPAEMPELHAIVDDLAVQAEIPKPRVYVMDEAQPNAFATGRNPERGVVAVTEGLLALLDRRELRGVIAHELAHIRNRDILLSSIAAATAAVITWLAQALSFGQLFGSNREGEQGSGPAALLAIFVAPIAASLIQLGISRSREYLADESGARICGDPEALASALLKLERSAAHVPVEEGSPATASLFIVNPFGSMERASRWFSTHPATEERVERLLEMARTRSGTVRTRAIAGRSMRAEGRLA